MTVFDDGAEILFEIWPEAISATFIPESGDPVTGFNVVIDKTLRNLPVGYEVQSWGEVVQIEYILDQVGREARTNDRFEVGDTVYKVVDVIENDGRFVRVLAR